MPLFLLHFFFLIMGTTSKRGGPGHDPGMGTHGFESNLAKS